MITEDYVSFETAKLLKEKGFDLSEFHGKWAIDYDNILHDENNTEWEIIITESHYPLITIQMAMKWLREKHNLHIITLPYAPFDRHSRYPGEPDMVYIAQLFKGIIPIDEIGRSVIKLTHEEACEAAIKYCLENRI